MKVTVCEFPDEQRRKPKAWDRLAMHCASQQSELVVLPEMPFCDWRMFMSRSKTSKLITGCSIDI